MPSPTFELKNEIVRAGAGAGKTTRLTATVLDYARRFMTEHKRQPRIVVTTFTRKATQELRERLVREAVKANDPKLVRFVTSQADLHISTIHGVLSLFLRRYGQWMNLDSGFTIMEASAAEHMARKILRDCLVEHPQGMELFEDFSVNKILEMMHQLHEISFEDPSWQPLAAKEILNFLEKKIQNHEKSLITISEKILSECATENWVQYLSGMLAVLKLPDGPLVRLQSLLSWSGEMKKPRFMSNKPAFRTDLHEELVENLDALLDLSDDTIQQSEQFEMRTQMFLELAREFRKQFDERKKSLGLLEMADLERQVIQAQKERPELLQAFAAEWDFWLIDEYQDTSPRQVEVLKALTGRRPVFLVGDPQQSIYLFRGARSEVFENAEDRIAQEGGTLSQLQTNYRSRPELLYFLNDFFAQWPEHFRPMEARAPIAQKGALVAEFCLTEKGDESPYRGLLQFVSERLSNSGAQLHDFCVLARTHAELMEVSEFFQRYGYFIHLHASNGFYRRREILDALSFLKFLLNPLDNHNLIRLLRSPWFHWSDQKIVDYTSHRPLFLWTELLEKEASDNIIQKLHAAHARSQEVGLSETLVEALQTNGLFATCLQLDSSGQREANLWKLLTHLKSEEKTPGFQYLQFINQALDRERTSSNEGEGDAIAALEPNRIHFMTIHKAKGLKFKYVLVPNLHKSPRLAKSRGHETPIIWDESTQRMTMALRLGDERKLQHHAWAKEKLQQTSHLEIDEHLRLLYVALTRAEEAVCLHWRVPAEGNSWAGRMRWDLSDGEQKTDHYTYCVRREFSDPKAWSAQMRGERPLRGMYQEANQKPATQRMSVTKLLDTAGPVSVASAVANKQLAISQMQKQIESPVIGLKLHTYLERLRHHPELSLKNYSERWFRDDKNIFSQAVDYVTQLNQPPMRELLQVGEVEWGFQLATSFGVLEGQIDLWGTVDTDKGPVTWVIDYKSGSSRYREKAFAQLELYAHALTKFGIGTPIHLAVIYAMDKQTEVRDFDPNQDVFKKYLKT